MSNEQPYVTIDTPGVQVDILGTFYRITFEDFSDDLDTDGLCDYTAHTIKIRNNNTFNVGNFKRLQAKVLRHEIIHAFMAESGLQADWYHQEDFGHDETTVDWFAIQFPKILKVFTALNILE